MFLPLAPVSELTNLAASTDQLVLLHIAHLQMTGKITLDWKLVAEQLTDYTSGEAIKQHLQKVRNARICLGMAVPPQPPKRGAPARDDEASNTFPETAKGLVYFSEPKAKKKQANGSATKGATTSQSAKPTQVATSASASAKVSGSNTKNSKTAQDKNKSAQTVPKSNKKRALVKEEEDDDDDDMDDDESPLKRISLRPATKTVNYRDCGEEDDDSEEEEEEDDNIPAMNIPVNTQAAPQMAAPPRGFPSKDGMS